MKMSKFFSQAEEQKQSEITNSEKEYAHPEQEITDKVIGYFTSGTGIRQMMMRAQPEFIKGSAHLYGAIT